jgi:hypothetical protein
MRAILIAVLVGAGCTPGPASLPYQHSAAPPPPRPAVVTLVLEPSLASLAVPPLAEAGLPPGYRELRISRGHGMVLGSEYPLVRVGARAGKPWGEVIRFHGTRAAGGDVHSPIVWSARVVRPSAPVDWSSLLRRLDSLGVESLEPPRYDSFVSDAGDLVVESREGEQYRAYEINAPHLRGDPVSARAAAIARVVDSLDRLTRGH